MASVGRDKILKNVADAVRKWFYAVSKDMRYFVLVPAVMFILMLQFASISAMSDSIDRAVLHPSLYRFRDWINSENLDSRIKIFAIDDQTMSYLKSNDLKLSDWAVIFREIGKKTGVKVIVDKMFADDFSSAEIEKFGLVVSETKPWVSIIGHSYPKSIRFRKEISRDSIVTNMNGLISVDAENDPAGPTETLHFFGASNHLLKKFNRFGHAEYSNSHDIQPVIRADRGVYVPHTALTVASKLDIKGGEIWVNDRNIHASKNGKILVNFLHVMPTEKKHLQCIR